MVGRWVRRRRFPAAVHKPIRIPEGYLTLFGLVCADMDSCGLGEDGAIALAKSLPSARTLLVLDIRGNDIGARKSSR